MGPGSNRQVSKNNSHTFPSPRGGGGGTVQDPEFGGDSEEGAEDDEGFDICHAQ
jgi:hypothetical protein